MTETVQPTPATDLAADALCGPWQAVLADRHGFVYNSVTDAVENVEDPYEEVTVTVVRGTALPTDRDGTTGCRLRLPRSYNSGDVAYEIDDVCLVDADDPSVEAEARWVQAQAMAAGLNAAGAVTQ